MIDASQFPPEIEALLRQSAPVLPVNLKSRTLARCAFARQKRRERHHRALTFAVAGVFALQMLTLSRLDAQNAQLIAGNGSARAFAAVSLAEVFDALHQRSRQIALLLETPKLG